MSARRIILLGSTGSIGTSTLEVIEQLNAAEQAFDVVALAAGSSHEQLAAQARAFNVECVSLVCEDAAAALPADIDRITGPDAAAELVREFANPGDIVVAAMVGIAGLRGVLEAIDRGCDVALANKETLVAAGALVIPAAAEANIELLPVDSEHSAIMQCLQRHGGADCVKRVVLTASGGPFRGCDRTTVHAATPKQALAHPTWDMGRKISVDSATLMNKALELIEAQWLFGLEPDQIDAVIHPQSIVHGFVEYDDGSVLAQMGPPDMRTPIQVALTWPDVAPATGRCMDFEQLRSLHFEQINHSVFPSITMARQAMHDGGTAGAVLNAANEAAVEAFLAGHIGLGDIWACIEEAQAMLPATPIESLDDVLAADASAREVVERRLDALQGLRESKA